MRRVHLKTLGCKVNTFDSQVIESQLVGGGFEMAVDPDQADIFVLNTCSVTHKAQKDADYWLRRIKRQRPDIMNVVTGCYAQVQSKSLSESENVDILVTNEKKQDLVDLLKRKLDGEELPVLEEVKAQKHFKSALTLFDRPVTSRTRGFLKIQDGCNNFCAYCQIPWARGASRSVPPEEVKSVAKRMVDSGVSELVLTGIHIGDYGEDLAEGKSKFVSLLEELLRLNGLKRLRISSLEPSECSTELLEVLKAHEDIFCDHFHLPLQAGCDEILKKMGRSYDTFEYLSKVEEIRRFFPEAQITADVIPGFPGETDEHFEDTMTFIKACGLANLHVFPYSKRPNTRALRMPDHVDPFVVNQRAKALRDLSQELTQSYGQKFFGRDLEVLWESDKDGFRVGKTKNYLPVIAKISEIPVVTSFVRLKGWVEKNRIFAISTDKN